MPQRWASVAESILRARKKIPARPLVAGLPGEQRVAVARVEGAHVRVGLHEPCSCREAIERSHTTLSEWPPPAAQPETTATTTFGIVRINRCTSRMQPPGPGGVDLLSRRCSSEASGSAPSLS